MALKNNPADYTVTLEISGPAAMWTRPDTGDAPVSYAVPTRCGLRGLFESILYLRSARVVPLRVEICRPIVFRTYTTNYGGPLRKSEQIRSGDNFQLVATVLADVCYRVTAAVLRVLPETNLSERARAWSHANGAHAYVELFDRRLRRGQFYRTPCLGWQEFVPDYIGPPRPETMAEADLAMVVPELLEEVFDPETGKVAPRFRRDLRVEKGVLFYDR
jgi:CRISPR-associated protein Cas5d